MTRAIYQPVVTKEYQFRYVLAFGSNLGQKVLNCFQGLGHLELFGSIIGSSKWIITEPFEKEGYDTSDHQPYINFVIDYGTDLKPHNLYQQITIIENQVGHDRSRHWAPRKLDIDILKWSKNNGLCFTECEELIYSHQNEPLSVPHPDYQNRKIWHDLSEDLHRPNNNNWKYTKEFQKVTSPKLQTDHFCTI